MSIEFLDPTHETVASSFAPARRLSSLEGVTIGLISNGKEGTKGFFDAFERELGETQGVARVVRMTKANFSAPAEPEIWARARGCDALIAGVGD